MIGSLGGYKGSNEIIYSLRNVDANVLFEIVLRTLLLRGILLVL
jgi:hypothetical protein